ncbi:MAG: hypothetical protein RLY14_202 [Planctomycetota bacterium]|jgi:hypothetical protein
MTREPSIKTKLHSALRERIKHPTDTRGYTKTPTENLVEGVSPDLFENDLRDGSGEELRMKFCAAHSSAALAVNTFAWFKAPGRLPMLSVFGESGASALRLEKQFPIFNHGTPPNLDVWIERDQDNIAIESKLTEYFTKTRPDFRPAYERLAPPGLAEPCWWQVYEQAKSAEPRHLDVAQLVKHYFGLRKYHNGAVAKKPIRLLYLFWEPTNWQDIPVCQNHRREVDELAKLVASSTIKFTWMTYSQLWQEWSKSPNLIEHAKNLKDRYEISA